MNFLDKVKASTQKAGKAIQDKYNAEVEKARALRELRGKRLGLLAAEYVGGYGEYKKSKGILTFYENRFEYRTGASSSFQIESHDIEDVAIEGRHEVNRRVTVTRLLAVGIFAFALKKKQEEKDAFITIVLTDAQEIVFHIKEKSPLQLKSDLSNVLSHFKYTKRKVQKSEMATDSSQKISNADELMKLAILRKKGILTEEEFQQQKKRLLETQSF